MRDFFGGRKLKWWQEWFRSIYWIRDKRLTREQLWSRLLEECGEVIRAIHGHEEEDIPRALSDIFAWLIAFCNLEEMDLRELLLTRYGGGICPKCKGTPVCLCLHPWIEELGLTRSIPDSIRRQIEAGQKSLVAGDLETLEDWERIFSSLYALNNRVLSLAEISSRLLAEIGEVAKTIRLRKADTELQKGLADVFAWSMAVWTRFKYEARPTPVLAEKIAAKYQYGCFKCGNKPCTCPGPWAKVFVSSVMDETSQEREWVAQMLREKIMEPVMFERFSGPFHLDQEEASLRKLKECDGMVLVLSSSITPAVYAEFYTAFLDDKPIIIMLAEGVEETPPLERFVREKKPHFKLELYREEDEFKAKLSDRIDVESARRE